MMESKEVRMGAQASGDGRLWLGRSTLDTGLTAVIDGGEVVVTVANMHEGLSYVIPWREAKELGEFLIEFTASQ